MPRDLDQSGNPEHRVRAYLGPSLGWKEVFAKPQQFITAAGTTTLAPGSGLVLVNVAGSVTINLPDVIAWVNEVATQPATAFERAIVIKDLGGNAGTFPITVVPFGTQRIDSVTGNFSIGVRGQAIDLIPLDDLSGWTVASGVSGATQGINNQTGTSYTLQTTDAGKLITFNNASPITVTVPTGLAVPFNCSIAQIGQGQVQLAAAVGVTITSLNNFTGLSGMGAQVFLSEYMTNAYELSGDLAAAGLAAIVGPLLANYNMVQTRSFTPGNNAFGSAAWVTNQTTVSGAVFTAPDNTTTAQKLTESSATSTHTLGSSGYSYGTTLSKVPFRFQVIAKAAGRTRMLLQMAGGGGNLAGVNFDLVGGNTGFDNTGAGDFAAVPPTSSMTNLGGGWWRCIMDCVKNPTDSDTFVSWTIGTDAGSGTGARNNSYAGDGTSGILLWFANLMPKSFTVDLVGNQTFFDDFASSDTIDLNDTGVAGKNWYTHNTWPNSPGNQATAVPSPAGNFSVANSVLTIAKGSNSTSGLNVDLSTARVKPGDNTSFIGQVFNPPFVAETRLAYNKAIVGSGLSPGGSSLGWWMIDVLSLTVPQPTNKGTEYDSVETNTGSNATQTTATMHDWTWSPLGSLNAGTISGLHPATTSDFHNYAVWITPSNAANNNIGFQMNFFDGIWVNQSFFAWTTVGSFSIWNSAASTKEIIQLTAASGTISAVPTDFPLFVDWVRVWQ